MAGSVLRVRSPIGLMAGFAAIAALVLAFAGGWDGDALGDGPGVRAWLAFALEADRAGGVPYWLDGMWGGTPAWALGPVFTIGWMLPLAHLVGVEAAVKVGIIVAQIVAGWGTLVLARSLWHQTIPATAAGALYALSPMVIGHGTLFGLEPILWVIAAVPWFAWAFRHALMRGGRWTVAAGAIAAFALLQQAEHAYGLALLGAGFLLVALYRGGSGLRPDAGRILGRAAIAGLVAAGLAAHWLLPLGALHDAFVFTPDDTVHYELTRGGAAQMGATPQVFVRPELAGGNEAKDLIPLARGSFYLGVGAVGAAVIGLLLLRRDRDGWMTAALTVGAFSVWTSTGGVSLARGTLDGAGGVAAFAWIGVVCGLLFGAVLSHVRAGVRRGAGWLLAAAAVVAVPFVTPFLTLRAFVPLLDNLRFPRLYFMAILAVSLAAAWPITVLAQRFHPSLAGLRRWFSVSLAVALMGVVLVDLQPYRRFFELRAEPRTHAGLERLSRWTGGLGDGERLGTQMFDRPAVIEAMQSEGADLVVGWPHPLASAGVWHLTGEAAASEREYARRAMGLLSMTKLVSDGLMPREPGDLDVGGYWVSDNPHALPVARVYDRALVVRDPELAGRLAPSLAHKGIAVVDADDTWAPPPTVQVTRLPDLPCPRLIPAAEGLAIAGADLGSEVARACALGRWVGLVRHATPGAEQQTTVTVVVPPALRDLTGIALSLDRPPGTLPVVTVARFDEGELGPTLATVGVAGANADGLFEFRVPPLPDSAEASYAFTISCARCLPDKGPRVRTAPALRGEPDVAVDGVALDDEVALAVPLYAEDAHATVGPVAATARHAGEGRWDVESPTGGLLVLAASAFPGWRATVDGADADVVAADSGLVGVALPAGAHSVGLVWERPVASVVGRAVTAATGAVGLLVLVWPRRRARKRALSPPVPIEAPTRAAQARPLRAPRRVPVSVVVPTSNDAANIGPLLHGLLEEPEVAEIVVVASGCEDDTVSRVLMLAATPAADDRVRIVVEDERTGKANALNLGFANARYSRVVAVSGDVLPEPGAVGMLVAALDDPEVGMSGARPVPVNDPESFLGHTVHLLWRLHDRMARREPKLGEMVALRADLAAQLPLTSVDEAWLQALVHSHGYRCAYVPGAVVHNRGPGTVADFVRQRRRVHGGHLWLKRRSGYVAPSLRPMTILRDLIALSMRDHGRRRVRHAVWSAGAASLEAWARLLARTDVLTGREHHVWKLVASAKDPARGADPRLARRSSGVPAVGSTAAAAGERHDQHELPVQLQVRDVQRVRASRQGAHGDRVGAGVPLDGPRPDLDDVQRR